MPLSFDPSTTFPPPGRTRLSWDEAEAELVKHDRFEGSLNRRDLWDGLERYVGRFVALGDLYADRLQSRPLLKHLWLGGSFVSTKRDPDNIDFSVFVDAEARNLIKGQQGSGWFADAFNRDKVKQEYGLSPLPVMHLPIPSVFVPERLSSEEQAYLQMRGAHDDWWQRCRDDDEPAPTISSTQTRRGYLEVTL